MKLVFEDEDCIYGILQGEFIIGLSGLYFSIEKITSMTLIPIIIFSIGLILTFLDFFNNLIHIDRHVILTSLAILTNIIDSIVEAGFIYFFSKLNIPIISNYLTYLEDPQILFYIGVWVLGSSIVWLALWFLND